jgi:PAS domain S-box-containing protein
MVAVPVLVGAVVAAGVCGVLATWLVLRSRTQQRLRLRESARDELLVMLDAVADAITAQDRAGRVVYANEAAARSMGFASPEELVHTELADYLKRFEILDMNGEPFDPADLPGRHALAGEESPAPAMVRFRVLATGEERYTIVKARAVRDERGEPVMAINVMEDVTEQKRAELAQRFLADVSAALAESLDLETTLRTVERLAVPGVADRAWVDDQVPADDGERAHGIRAVVETGEAQLSSHLIVAPLVARGRTVAALSLARDADSPPFDQSDLEVAVEVGMRAGLALDNARLFSDRAYTAQALQQSLLPPVLPAIPGLEVASRFRAAGSEVGGDFYDLFEVGDGGWALVVGDVCGKGPDAAAVTALARYTIRAGAMQRSYPSHILTLLNDALLRQRTGADFCTVAMGRFDVREDGAILVLASGGHPLPLLLRADGEVCPIGRPGTLLGVIPNPDVRDEAVELAPGDVVVFYTDGVTEAGAPNQVLDPDGLASLIEGCQDLDPSELAERIERAAVEVTDGALRDDIAILVARVRPPALGADAVAEAAGAAEA